MASLLKSQRIGSPSNDSIKSFKQADVFRSNLNRYYFAARTILQRTAEVVTPAILGSSITHRLVKLTNLKFLTFIQQTSNRTKKASGKAKIKFRYKDTLFNVATIHITRAELSNSYENKQTRNGNYLLLHLGDHKWLTSRLSWQSHSNGLTKSIANIIFFLKKKASYTLRLFQIGRTLDDLILLIQLLTNLQRQMRAARCEF